MKTQIVKSLKVLGIIAGSVTAVLISVSAAANEQTGSRGDKAQVIYRSQAAHPSIYSYPSNVSEEISLKPSLIFVSQAYGPAIHSYEHAGSEITAPWNVEYVDTAYGPAIFSYEGRKTDGQVNVLPIVDN